MKRKITKNGPITSNEELTKLGLSAGRTYYKRRYRLGLIIYQIMLKRLLHVIETICIRKVEKRGKRKGEFIRYNYSAITGTFSDVTRVIVRPIVVTGLYYRACAL